MKSFVKVCLATALLLIVIGCVTVAAVGAAGRKEKGSKQEQSTETWERSVSEKQEEDIHSVELSVKAGSVSIKEGDTFRLEIKGTDEENFRCEMIDGIWLIEDLREEKHVFSVFENWFGITEDSVEAEQPYLCLTVPKDFCAEHIKIELGAGELKADVVRADKLTATVGAGAVYLYEAKADTHALFEIGTGEMKVYGFEGGSVEIDCGIGALYLEGSICGKSKINNGIGEVKLKLTGSEADYSYSVNCGLGSVQIGSKSYHGVSQSSSTSESGDGFEIDCGIGSVQIRFDK